MRSGEPVVAVAALAVVLLLLVPAVPTGPATPSQTPTPRSLASSARSSGSIAPAHLPDFGDWSTTTGRSSPGAPDLKLQLFSRTSAACPTSYPNSGAWLAYDAVSHSLWVAAPPSCVDVLISNQSWLQLDGALPVGTDPFGIAVDNATDSVFVTNTGSHNVSVISAATRLPLGSVAVGSQPYGVAYDWVSDEVYVANGGDNTVTAIAASNLTVVATIGVGSQPVGVVADPASGRVFVANSGSANVTVISDRTDAVVANVPAGSGPYGLALDNATDEIFVTNQASNNLTVIDAVTARAVATVPVVQPAIDLQGIAYDFRNDAMWVGAGWSFAIVVEASARIVTGFLASDPSGVAYDSDNGDICVTNAANFSFGCFAQPPNSTDGWPAARLTFNESGLPDGTRWGVAVGGVGLTSLGTNLSYGLIPAPWAGRYFYSVPTVQGFVPTPSSGGVTPPSGLSTGGPPIFVDLAFAPAPSTYPVNFTAVGLPAGTTWSVNLSGSVGASNSSVDQFWVPNGSYGFTIASALGPAHEWLPSPSNGTVIVAGQPVHVTISFVAAPAPFPVSFTESGLPPGTTWSVTFDGVLGHTNTSTNVFWAPDGTDNSFSVPRSGAFAPIPTRGTVSVHGGPVTVAIRFTQLQGPTFALWFNETGLPSGFFWSVTIDGGAPYGDLETNGSTTSSIGFVEPVGFSGSYSVFPPSGYVANPSLGGIYIPVSLAPVTYRILFAPVGPPPNPPVIWEFLALPSPVTVGATLEVTVVATADDPPLSYGYVGLPVGCTSANQTSLACRPLFAGTTTITVTVADAGGRVAQASVNVTVVAPSTWRENATQLGPTFLGLPAVEGFGVFAAILLLVLGLVIVGLRRSLPGPGRPPVSPPP